MDQDLLRAYRATAYLAFPPGGAPVEARLDRASPALDALLAARGALSGVFVTAWNPMSRLRPEAENRAAHARLEVAVAALRLPALPHAGRADDGGWAEEGLLVLGLDPGGARDLAGRFAQRAVVLCLPGLPAALLWT
ncbi:DUF3293 domain-containing protein [Arenibaculum pallidiluteum]|uniref:DUF3293 domain-containing protein n=1 Tax=Arenibaculum pallidiluteum TaxID=2812559 RepID=UPI001A96373D|nr:DUF3293 domain-containing protein [Arenibaculum pallidiluteum]